MIVFTTPRESLVRTFDYRNVEAAEPVELRDDKGDRYQIPIGAKSDLASISSKLWSLGLPPFGTYGRGCRVHDAAYRGDLLKLVDGAWVPANLDREPSDHLLNDCMIADGVDEAQRIAIFEGVRFGGWKAFREDRRELNPTPH